MAAPLGGKGLKGAGKGPAPPPVAGPLAGKGVKGAGKAPPLPPRVLSKGAGKSKPSCKGSSSGLNLQAPPKELVAPAGSVRLRLEHGLSNAQRTMWEGLGLWGTADAENILEGTVIDFAAISKLWEPMPAPPAPESFQRSARRSVLPAEFSRQAEVAVKGAKLTADLVRQALTEDMLAISDEQAHILNAVLAPMAQEASALLQGAVTERGISSLSNSEAVLWAISCISAAELRARLVAEQHELDADVAQVRNCVAKAESIVTMLKESRPVRSLLQMILVAKNVLGQAGHVGFQAKSFDGLSRERLRRHTPTSFDPETGEVIPVPSYWLNANNPSVIMLVAQMMESTHECRCRLRFLRMVAVGRAAAEAGLSDDNVLQNIWSYLDDLSESPRDVLPMLSSCSQCACDRDLFDYIRGQCSRYQLMLPYFEQLERSMTAAETTGRFFHQLQELRGRYTAAMHVCENSSQELGEVARNLCELGGERGSAGLLAFGGSSDVLRSLRFLGQQLAEAMEVVQVKRAAELAAQRAVSGRPVRRWQRVDTSHTLWCTRDPEVIRQLKLAPALATEELESQEHRQGQQAPATAAALVEADQEQGAREGTTSSFHVNLMHSGPDGVYVRDPVSGSWGRRQDGVEGTAGSHLRLGGPQPDP
eukprot:TRINITY_DN34753_c0_g1_i1.p1 TRINITY_DN34753_c0_g1~~TRINITY_DN34753_c0_g1_i1.p1  ORF type:complete len:662 (+),score=128.69 TRINITY_DN34753_c0_g1_i1:42-1988(+)